MRWVSSILLRSQVEQKCKVGDMNLLSVCSAGTCIFFCPQTLALLVFRLLDSDWDSHYCLPWFSDFWDWTGTTALALLGFHLAKNRLWDFSAFKLHETSPHNKLFSIIYLLHLSSIYIIYLSTYLSIFFWSCHFVEAQMTQVLLCPCH